jgi:cation:H+ antiporter
VLDIVVGLILLVAGAELLVRGSSRLAVAAGIPPLIIGLTVVAYGTSAPELAVSMVATLDGQSSIALGNVVGSNIFNILCILGLSAMIVPLTISAQLVRLDVPIMIITSLVLMLIGWNGRVGRVEGVLLFVSAIIYTILLVRLGRRDPTVQAQRAINPERTPPLHLAANFGIALFGLALLIWGSQRLVDGAIVIARELGVSELVIGLTIVAAGTSLPELATSTIAAIRRERDIAVGNLVGSNIFNILVILGATAAIAPQGVEVSSAARAFDIPVMVAVAVACLPIFFTGCRISRWEGVLFFFYYIAYVVYVLLNAAGHDALEEFGAVMMLFVIPLTVLGITVSWLRERRRGGETAERTDLTDKQ